MLQPIVVVVFESPQALKDDPEKRLRLCWEASELIEAKFLVAVAWDAREFIDAPVLQGYYPGLPFDKFRCCWCHRKHPRTTGKCVSSSRSSLVRSKSKAGQRSHLWENYSSLLLQRRHMTSSYRLNAFCGRWSAGWYPQRKRLRSIINQFHSRYISHVAARAHLGPCWRPKGITMKF